MNRSRPNVATRISRRVLLSVVWLAPILGLPAGADSDPFEALELRVPGRPTQVWCVPLSTSCGPNALDLLVISIQQIPPKERRHVTIFPCDPEGRAASTSSVEIQIDPAVVGIDVYDVDGETGGELLLIDREGVTIVSPFGTSPPREVPVPGGLPLPPRARGLSRIPVAGNWNGNGQPVAMLPTVSGGLLLDLHSGETRRLELPLIAQYRTWDPDFPGRVRKLMIAEFHWPVLMMADDNGDGRADLFALTRWDIWIFHAGENGLPSTPSRRISLQPFDEKEEMRHEITDVTYFATDLNGDGLADLILHRNSGGIMAGRAVTDIYMNRGEGASGVGRPDTRLEVTGFSGVEPVDLDGDGRTEIIETSGKMGILQVVRMLLTRKASFTNRILVADPSAPGRFVSSFEQDMAIRINFGEGRIDGLLPSVEGDWNGDGRKDLLYGDGSQRVSIRLGEAGERGPRFGDVVASQKVPLSTGRTRIADLNGDGLDDLVAYDPRDVEGRIFVFYNRGQLPGTRPNLEASSGGRVASPAR